MAEMYRRWGVLRMNAIYGITVLALISVLVGQIAKYLATIVSPDTLSYIIGAATLFSMFAAITIAKED